MSWKNRATSKSWRAPPKNVELMPQHQDLGFQLLSRVSSAGIRLGSWESARARLVSPAQASLPRSWPTPELHIRNAAAGTRTISAAGIRLGQRKSVRSSKGYFATYAARREIFGGFKPVLRRIRRPERRRRRPLSRTRKLHDHGCRPRHSRRGWRLSA